MTPSQLSKIIIADDEEDDLSDAKFIFDDHNYKSKIVPEIGSVKAKRSKQSNDELDTS